MLYKVKVSLVESFIFPIYWYFDCKCNIVFQEFKKENPQKFDNLPVHFGQLEFRESLVKSLLGLDSGVKHSDFKCTCMPSFNENSNRLRCIFCYAHAKLNELPEINVKQCSIVEIVMWIFVFHPTEIALLNSTVENMLEWGLW